MPAHNQLSPQTRDIGNELQSPISHTEGLPSISGVAELETGLRELLAQISEGTLYRELSKAAYKACITSQSDNQPLVTDEVQRAYAELQINLFSQWCTQVPQVTDRASNIETDDAVVLSTLKEIIQSAPSVSEPTELVSLLAKSPLLHQYSPIGYQEASRGHLHPGFIHLRPLLSDSDYAANPEQSLAQIQHRVYVNWAPLDILNLAQHIITDETLAGKIHTLKIANYDGASPATSQPTSRRDKCVIFVKENGLSATLDSIQSWSLAHTPETMSRGPLFTRTVAPGVSVGEEPQTIDGQSAHDQSFSEQRASLLLGVCRSVVHAALKSENSPEEEFIVNLLEEEFGDDQEDKKEMWNEILHEPNSVDSVMYLSRALPITRAKLGDEEFIRRCVESLTDIAPRLGINPEDLSQNL